jgi:superfamily II DNA or RNA helicase
VRSNPQNVRPYQREALVAWKIGWTKRNDKGQFLRLPFSLATGAGKTTIIAQGLREMLDPTKQRALVVAHREELITQPYERIRNQFAELESWYVILNSFVPGIGIVMAAQNDYSARIVVATVQSLSEARVEQILEAGMIDIFIVDEAHHDYLNTYARVEKQLRAKNPDLKKAGFSATWERTDKKPLSAGYDEVDGPHKPFAYEWSVLDGITQGFLVPPTCLQVQSSVDLSAVPTVAGDYNQKQLASMLEAANWPDLAVDAAEKYLLPTRKHIISFFNNVENSKTFVEHLNKRGITAASR